MTTSAASQASLPRGRRTARPSGDDRELAILATAENLLEDRPLADISVDDLAKGAGISRPTFYFYFPSKEAVLLTLLDRVVNQADMALQTLAENPADTDRENMTDTRQRLPAVGLAVPLPRRVVKALDNVGGIAIGHHPPRVVAVPVLVIGDLPQRCYRVHYRAHTSCPKTTPVTTTAKPAISPRMSNAINTPAPFAGRSNWFAVARRAPWVT